MALSVDMFAAPGAALLNIVYKLFGRKFAKLPQAAFRHAGAADA
jgi:hypothetical protein